MKEITLNGCTYTLVKGDRAKGWYNQYLRLAGKTTLDDVYGRYSHRKQMAYGACRARMEQTDSVSIRILSTNCHFFTVGYIRKSHDYLLIETYANSYAIDLNDMIGD